MINGLQILTHHKMKKQFALLVLVFALTACKKNNLGGNATLEGVVMHHSKVINKASVFIKFNSKDLPGLDTNLYDAKVRVDKDGYFKFEVYKGDYYVYAFGYDYGIPSPFHVVGGQAAKLRAKEKVTITLSVTED